MADSRYPARLNQPEWHEVYDVLHEALVVNDDSDEDRDYCTDLTAKVFEAIRRAGAVTVRDASGLLHNGDTIEQTAWWDTVQSVCWATPDPLDDDRCVPVWRRVETS